MGNNRRMDHMTWPEFKEAKTRPVIVPIGSTEQHGQHLPIGTDAVLATRVAEDLAERIDGTVLPTLSYGYKSKPLGEAPPPELGIQSQAALRWRAAVPGHYRHERRDSDQPNARRAERTHRRWLHQDRRHERAF